MRLRGPFIDAEDAAPMAHPWRRRPRARSAPPRVAQDEGSGAPCIFAEERDYVARLSERLGVVWGAVDASPATASPGAIAAAALGFVEHDHRSVAAHDAAAAAAAVDKLILESSIVPVGGGQGEPAKDVILLPEPEEVRPAAGSIGSLAHPHLCSRPCLYFASGQCVNGGECGFCHLPHPRREAHLDKKYREILRAMLPGRASALLLPLLWEKMLDVRADEAARAIFHELAGLCGDGASLRRLPSAMSRGERALLGTLRPMRLRSLLIAAQRCVLHRNPTAQVAADELLAKLRGGPLA